MSRPTLKALYLKDGSPSEALLSALTALRCANLEQLQDRVKRGRIKREQILGTRGGGSHYRPGLVARVLFGKPRKVARSTRRTLPRLQPSPAPVSTLGDDTHEREHLALFTD